MKQFTLFLVIIVLADFSFGLPVTKVEEKKEEIEEKHEQLGDDIEVKHKNTSKSLFAFVEFSFFWISNVSSININYYLELLVAIFFVLLRHSVCVDALMTGFLFFYFSFPE